MRRLRHPFAGGDKRQASLQAAEPQRGRWGATRAGVNFAVVTYPGRRQKYSVVMGTDFSSQGIGGTSPYELTLLRSLVIERHWQKFAAFEAQFSRAAAELAERQGEPRLKKVTVSRRQFERWYAGRVKTEPYPDACRVLEYMFGYPVQQLLVPARYTSQLAAAGLTLAPQRLISGSVMPADATRESRPSSSVNDGDLIAASEWPVWFGVRLAHLIALTDNWEFSAAQLDSLQTLVHQEILMFDASAPEGAHPLRAVHALSRRQALVTVAALPLALATSSTISAGARGGAATDFFLARCAASITACWHLLRGSDLATVDQTLSGYILALESAAQQQTRYQVTAARLASQAHRILRIVALHRRQMQVLERHSRQALYYADVASDTSSRAAALISLANTHFYNSDPAQAVVIYEQALGLGAGISALQRSRAHAELAVAYGQLRREKDAIRSAGIAGELYPDHPEQDHSFLYAEFTSASLSLEQGLAYLALAEQHSGRGYQRRAADFFERVDQGASAVPDRIRFEITNHQARTAVLLDDLDAFEEHASRGIDGVVLLGSKQRGREIRIALQRAWESWPRERRVRSLGERLQITAGDKSEGNPS